MTERLAVEAEKARTLLVTIDPERDTPSARADFVPRLAVRVIGFAATPDQIARTAAAFRIRFEKIEEAAPPDGCTMGRSSQPVLFDPQAGYVMSRRNGTPADEILADLWERT